jgi:hydrophobic/amphiphilic exporter-1 (mainly G- bacteria), HAE1 family
VLLSDTAIKRPIFTTMIMLGLAIFGVISLTSLGLDLFPRVEVPVITVISVLPGADPNTVETTVSKPIEDVLSSISSIKHLRSTSADSVSQVVVEFELEKNIDVAFQEVQAKLSTVRSDLPQDLEDPIIEKFDIDSMPIMAVVVSGKQPIQELSHIADKVVKTRLQQVKDVGEIKRIGTRDRNIWINLDPHKLEGFNISSQEVVAALKAHHIELPAGRIETGSQEFIVKTKAEFSNVSQLNDMLVAYRNDYPIHISDIGYVVDGLEEERSLSRLNDQKAVALLVRRQSGTNTVSVANDVKEQVEKLAHELESQKISFKIARDLSVYIEHSIHEIQFHLVFGGALAVLIVFIFLRNVRITLMSALAIPLSVASTFILMRILGFTMNTMTMLALSLAIGILIDDAIVVVENIYRHFMAKGSAKEAAKIGTQEIGLAAFAITMSIVAVFLPVAFMKGMIGRFLYQFGVTVTVAVLVSLFVAFTLTPMLASQFLKKESYQGRLSNFLGKAFALLDHGYTSLLRCALNHRIATIAIACASLCCVFFLRKYIRAEFLPLEDQSEFSIKVKTPLGSSIKTTDEAISSVRAQIEKEPWVEYTFTEIGTDNLVKVNEGNIYVKMADKDKRAIGQFQAMEIVRKKIDASSRQYKISVDPVMRISGGGRRTCSIQVDIKGNNLDTIESIAQTLISRLQEKEGYVDLDLSYDKGKPEVDVAIKRDRAAALGVTPAAIAQAIKTMVGGIDVAKYNDDGDRYNISVRLQDQFRDAPETLFDLSVRNSSGELISLQNLVEVRRANGPVQIDRENRERIISVYVNLIEGKKALGQGVDEISSILHEMKLPPGYSFQFTGMADVMKESFSNLLFALILAIAVVYMVLSSQFESFIYPFIIMLSLPFSIIGALGGIVVTQSTLNINTIIGIIMLMGLVTKNAILLVDYTNTLRERDKLSTIDALLAAGATRLHPILMTTLAMIFGMLPIALSHGPGSESRAPMAIATIGGLATSMLLTLVVVPVVYACVDRLQEKVASRRKDSNPIDLVPSEAYVHIDDSDHL